MFKKIVILCFIVLICLSSKIYAAGEKIPSGSFPVILGVTDDANRYSRYLRATDEGYLKVSLGTAITSTSDSIQSMQYKYDGSAWNPVLEYKLSTVGSITTTGLGVVQNVLTSPMKNWTMIIDRSVGSTNTVEVDLICSLDGVDVYQIATITDLTVEPAGVNASNIPCAYFTYNVVTVGSGNTLQIHILGTK